MTEVRSFKQPCEVREGPNGPMICGYGVVFNSDSSDMGFIEQVDPGAATKTIQEADVRGLANHDPNWLLGRVKSGTMRLRQDTHGVWYEIDVNTQDPDGVRALAKVQRRDWDGSSFTFQAIRDEWDWQSEPPRRRLLEFKMLDCGPVTYNAYPDATATSRALEPIAARVGKPVDELVAALAKGGGEIRSLINGGTMSTIEAETDAPASDPEAGRGGEPLEEGRAGKQISAANVEKLQAVHDSLSAAAEGIRDLMDVAQTGAPSDSEVGAPADKDPEEDAEGNTRSLSMLQAEVEMRQRVARLEAA